MYNLTGAAVGGNAVFITPALTGLSGGATTYSSSAFGFAVKGILYAKALVSGGATPTTDGVTAAAFVTQLPSKACCYVWAINLSGTVQVIQGPVVAYTDSTANSTRCPFPFIPDTSTPFAYSVIKTASNTAAAGWILGTSNWNATGVTVDTVVNVHHLPASDPLTA